MSKEFFHIIPNCNHAVSLAYFLSNLSKIKEHQILIEGSRYHKNNYFDKTKKAFHNTKHLDKNINLNKDQIIVFHGIFSQHILNLVHQLVESPVKVVWSIWGGDIKLLNDSANLKMLNNLDYVICTPGETLPYVNFTVPEINVCLYLPHHQFQKDVQKEDLVILGNSGDPSNKHEYLLRLVSKFKNTKIHIPFGYNNSESYLNSLVSLSKKLSIYERVYFHTEIMSLSEYYALFGRAKAYLSAHNRQQSLGTMQIAYILNCEVYLKKNLEFSDGKKMINPSYLTMQMLGYPDIKNITDLEKKDFIFNFSSTNDNPINNLNIQNYENRDRLFEIFKKL